MEVSVWDTGDTQETSYNGTCVQNASCGALKGARILGPVQPQDSAMGVDLVSIGAHRSLNGAANIANVHLD